MLLVGLHGWLGVLLQCWCEYVERALLDRPETLLLYNVVCVCVLR